MVLLGLVISHEVWEALIFCKGWNPTLANSDFSGMLHVLLEWMKKLTLPLQVAEPVEVQEFLP